MLSLHHLHSRPAVRGPLSLNADLLQRGDGAQAQILVIIHHQHSPGRKYHILLPDLRSLQIQCNMELAPLSGLALQFYRSLHGLYNGLCDGHAQSGSLGLAHLGRVLPGEGLKDLLLEFFGHTDSVILYPEMTPDIILSQRRWLLLQVDIDLPALRGKLYGV
ncbi:hypothetical protein IMSAG185_00365 [Lachnospiraceae bacterium]|nr:hypothetical protein IMSAG185_00365 [Lachnospiraceae bacterium]